MKGKSLRSVIGDETGANYAGSPDFDGYDITIRTYDRKDLAIAPGALRKREELVRKRREKEEWKLHRRHVEAIRNPTGLSMGRSGEGGGEAMSPKSKMKGLAEGFRALDPKRHGTVSPEDFVSVMRRHDLDMGDEATLALLQRYRVNSGVDYTAFVQNVRVLLFPRVAGHTSPLAARERGRGGRGGRGGGQRGEEKGVGGSISELEGPGETFIEISRDEGMSSGDHDSWRDSLHKATHPRWRATTTASSSSSSSSFPDRTGGRTGGKSTVASGRDGRRDKDDALLSSVRTTVANIWFRIRHDFPHFDESLTQKVKGRGNGDAEDGDQDLEAHLQQRRLLQVFQSALTPQQVNSLMDAYQSWCLAKGRANKRGGGGLKTWSEFLRLFIIADNKGGEVSGKGGFNSSLKAVRQAVSDSQLSDPSDLIREVQIMTRPPLRVAERQPWTKKHTWQPRSSSVMSYFDDRVQPGGLPRVFVPGEGGASSSWRAKLGQPGQRGVTGAREKSRQSGNVNVAGTSITNMMGGGGAKMMRSMSRKVGSRAALGELGLLNDTLSS